MRSDGQAKNRPVKLAYYVSHPIQYQAPLLRRLAREPDIDLTVLFGSHFSLRRFKDEGFGVEVTWDTPLLDGYVSGVLPNLRDTGVEGPTSPISRGMIRALSHADGSPAYDALWVHGYASVNAFQAILAGSAVGTPVIVRAESWLGDRERGWLKRGLKRVFFSGLKRLVRAVLPIGSESSAYWSFYFGDSVPQFLFPYAVDNEFFRRRAADGASRVAGLREELQLEAGRPVILFASKLQRRKLCDQLIEAFSKLRLYNDLSALPYLVIVGDGEERGRLEAQADALGLQDVRFAGFRNQTELPVFFRLASVFVLPSRHEPWGLIVNEAMAAGCPVVVSSDVGAQKDLVTNGIEGFVYPVDDVEALTEALAAVFREPETARRMGGAAQRRIESWSFEQDVAGLRQALQYVTGRLRA